MKKNVFVIFAIIMVVVLTCVMCACSGNEAGKGNEDETVKGNETPKVFLENITLDDERYSIGVFNKDVTEYIVKLPAGRPAVPRVAATAEDGVNVKITQAAIPDEAKSGKATILISDLNSNTNTYTVEFIRDKSNGFVLQYDDRYSFVPEHTIKEGDRVAYETSDESVISVDENGLMTAKKLSETSVTVTAKVNGVVIDTLTVDRVEKAHINLFLITGQSNGQGCYDSSNYGKDIDYLIEYEDQLKEVEKIGQMGRVYSYDVHPHRLNTEVTKIKGTMYDMEEYAKQGHQASLGKVFYELSGEKVVFLQSAFSGSPIESWLDPKKHKEAGTYGTHFFYSETKSAYNKLMKKLENNYEVVLVGNFWCQGETAMSAVYSESLGDYIFSSNPSFKKSDLITDETYYKYFMMLHEDMKEDFGIEYNGIMFVRTTGAASRTTIVPIVSAHFALCNNNKNINVATRTFMEIARQYKSTDKTSDGYGYIGTDDLHYNQTGYNYHGKEAGTNAFYSIFGYTTNVAQGVEIIATDGIRRLTSTDTVTFKKGMSARLGALPLPHYIDEKIVWTSSDENVVTVNEFGFVEAISSGNAVITAISESGQKQSFNCVVTK